MKTKNPWIIFILVMIISSVIPGYQSQEIYREATLVPEKVVTGVRT